MSGEILVLDYKFTFLVCEVLIFTVRTIIQIFQPAIDSRKARYL